MFLHQKSLFILIIKQLLVQYSNEGVLVSKYIPFDLFFSVTKLLDDGLHDFLVELFLRRPVVLEVVLEELLAIFKPVVDFRRLRGRHELLVLLRGYFS